MKSACARTRRTGWSRVNIGCSCRRINFGCFKSQGRKYCDRHGARRMPGEPVFKTVALPVPPRSINEVEFLPAAPSRPEQFAILPLQTTPAAVARVLKAQE